jgi:DinB superfamily
MTEVDRILDQYDRAMNGDAWHGDPVWTILEGISAEQAARRVHPQRHTIWELVAHMTFWETQVYRRLNHLPEMPTEKLNFPAMPEPRAENWQSTLADFCRSNLDFRQCVSQLDPARLDQAAPGRDKSIYVEVHGVIQHHLYHAGQIAILRGFATESTV